MSIPPSTGPGIPSPVTPQPQDSSGVGSKPAGKLPPHDVTKVEDPQKNLPKGKKRKNGKPLAERQTQKTTPDASLKKGKGAVPTATPGKTENTEKKEEQKDYSNMTKDQLLEEQSQALNKAKTISKRFETHSLMGRAQQFLLDPKNAPKDLNVTITLPGETKPISLIPLSKELAATPEKFAEYQKMALEILKQYEENHYQAYSAEQDTQTLEQLKDVMRQTAKQLKDNKHEEGIQGGFKNKWEQAWNNIRNAPVTLEAFEHDKNDSSVPRVRVSKPVIEPQEKKKPEEMPEDKNRQTPTSETETWAQSEKKESDTNVPPTAQPPMPKG